jgi:hypothetical protein
MSLPLSVERCPGRPAGTSQECVGCMRRQQGISDYVNAVRGVVWLEPGEETPCPQRLAMKGERHA